MTIPDATALPRLLAWGHGILLAVILACLWFPATRLPLGGPNVVAATIAIALGGFVGVVLWHWRARLPLPPSILWPICVSAAMAVWATARLIATDTFSITPIGQISYGAMLLTAVFLMVDTPRRARALMVFIASLTALSVLFGLAVAYYGDPLWRFWVAIANPEPRYANDVRFGRIAGISPRVVNLGFQLTVAAPFALAAFVYNRFGDIAKRRWRDVLLLATTLMLCIGVYFNTSRSAMLGTACGLLLVAISPLLAPPGARRRLLLRTLFAVLVVAAGFTTVVVVYHRVSSDALFGPDTLSVPAHCEVDLGVVASPTTAASGAWDGACESIQLDQRHARYFRFTLEAPTLVRTPVSMIHH